MRTHIDSVVQAFPTDHDGQMYGMTLRDYFAAAALTGISASTIANGCTYTSIADSAYSFADAMIKARSTT